MIETRRLKNVVIFIQTILNFVLSRKINNVFLVRKKINLHINRRNRRAIFKF